MRAIVDLTKEQVEALNTIAKQARMSHTLGDENYHVTFPFVRQGDDEPVKIIKSLLLAHQEPMRICEYGAAWIYRINRLKGRYLDPDRVLFTLAGPDKDENRLLAYHEIEEVLRDAGVKTVAFDYQDEITRFALN